MQVRLLPEPYHSLFEPTIRLEASSRPSSVETKEGVFFALHDDHPKLLTNALVFTDRLIETYATDSVDDLHDSLPYESSTHSMDWMSATTWMR